MGIIIHHIFTTKIKSLPILTDGTRSFPDYMERTFQGIALCSCCSRNLFCRKSSTHLPTRLRSLQYEIATILHRILQVRLNRKCPLCSKSFLSKNCRSYLHKPVQTINAITRRLHTTRSAII